MSKENDDVKAFQEKFGVPMSATPAFLTGEVARFRANFLLEEIDEFIDANDVLDLAGAADALIDLVYVAHGTALIMGLPWDKLWDEVQRANMTKMRATSAEDSKRKSSLDVIKPPGWVGPDHSAALGPRQFDFFCATCASTQERGCRTGGLSTCSTCGAL